MSSHTMPAADELGAAPALAEADPARAGAKRAKVAAARAGVAMAVATFAMAAASALQAVLYLSRFGVDGRTDGFFVAFALYTTFGVFGQSLRLTVVPLLVGPRARLSVREFAGVLVLIAIPVLIVTCALAGPVAGLLAPGLDPGDRAVTASALPVLGVAMALQLWASGGATVLAVRGRFAAVAASYVAGALAGLIAFLALMDVAGELTLGWSMLTMAVVTCGWMLVGVRASGGIGAGARLRLRRIVALTGQVLGRTSIYLAFNALFVITLAFASHSSAGDTTVLSYAYLFASYLVAGTGMALGMSRIPDMARAARTEQRAVIVDTVAPGFRYALLIVAPALAALIAAGAPLVHELLPGSLDADGVRSLQAFTALLVPWTAAALLVSLLMPALFAVGRAGLLNALSIPLLVIHLVATAVGQMLFGVEGSVAALCVAPSCFAATLLVVGAGPGARRVGRELAGGAVRFLGLAAVAFGVGAAVASALPSAAGAPVAVAIGGAIYVAGALVVARPQLDLLLGALRARAA
jgi:peptidoglycan biosynthesis protein MviN/MurJ (putative lipid II flippase)